MSLGRNALDYLDVNGNGPPGASYRRYFGTQPRVTVRAVFASLFNPNFRAGDSLLTIPSPKFRYMGKSNLAHLF